MMKHLKKLNLDFDDWDDGEIIKEYGYHPHFHKSQILYMEPVYDHNGHFNKLKYSEKEKNYVKETLKQYLKHNGEIPCIVRKDLNSCYRGCDVYETVVQFEITTEIINYLNDKECIGFNSNMNEIKVHHKAPNHDYIDPIIYDLTPLFKKEYKWEFNKDNPLKHIIETKSTLLIYKEDWNKLIDMTVDNKFKWCAHRNWKQFNYKDKNQIFKNRNYVYISFNYSSMKCSMLIYNLKDLHYWSKYYIKFKDLLNNKPVYYKTKEITEY